MSCMDLGAYMRKAIDNRGISISDLSRQTGLSRQAIHKILNGDIVEPDLSTIAKLCGALGMHLIPPIREQLKGMCFPMRERTMPHFVGDDVGFVGETIPDNSIVSINTEFVKCWEIQNVGVIPWRNRRLVCVDEQIELRSRSDTFAKPNSRRGLKPKTRIVRISDTSPGEIASIEVEFLAPSYPCCAISYWKMTSEGGEFCFPELEGLSCLVRIVAI